MKFYSNKILPKLNEYVIVKIIGHNNTTGILCQLLEYNNLDALILATEISKYKINIEKKFPINKEVICFVYSIDSNKNHINLSVKNISKDESDEILLNYKNKIMIYNFINKILSKKYDSIILEEIICKYFDLNLNYTFDDFLNNIDNLTNIFDSYIINLFKSKLIKTNMELELKFNLHYLENNFTEIIKKFNKNIKYISPGEYCIRLEFDNSNEEKYENKFLEYSNEIIKLLNNKRYILKFDINNIKTIKNSKYIIKNT